MFRLAARRRQRCRECLLQQQQRTRALAVRQSVGQPLRHRARRRRLPVERRLRPGPAAAACLASDPAIYDLVWSCSRSLLPGGGHSDRGLPRRWLVKVTRHGRPGRPMRGPCINVDQACPQLKSGSGILIDLALSKPQHPQAPPGRVVADDDGTSDASYISRTPCGWALETMVQP